MSMCALSLCYRFASNSQRPAAVYTHDTFKAGAYPAGPPLEQLHSMVAAKMKKKDPVQYFVSARPEAETTAQTMRMFGTYPIDAPRANQIGAFIPHMCPGGKPSYHPDVTTGNYGLKPTLPRMGFGSTLTDGRNLK